MTFSEDAPNELQAIIDQINKLEALSRQAIKVFSDTSERIDEMTYKVVKVKF